MVLDYSIIELVLRVDRSSLGHSFLPRFFGFDIEEGLYPFVAYQFDIDFGGVIAHRKGVFVDVNQENSSKHKILKVPYERDESKVSADGDDGSDIEAYASKGPI